MRKLYCISVFGLLLNACTTAQLDQAQTITERICISTPIAISLYSTATQAHDNKAVTDLINFLNITCPATLTALQLYLANKPSVNPNPPVPVPQPERG